MSNSIKHKKLINKANNTMSIYAMTYTSPKTIQNSYITMFDSFVDLMQAIEKVANYTIKNEIELSKFMQLIQESCNTENVSIEFDCVIKELENNDFARKYNGLDDYLIISKAVVLTTNNKLCLLTTSNKYTK